MRARMAFGLGCGLLLSLPGWAAAQVPLPGAPAAVAPPTAAAGTTAATQAATTAAPQKPLQMLLSCLCPTPEQWEARRQKFCNCALGQMLNSMLKPVTLFSGGLIPDICPPNKPNLDDLKNKAPDSAEGAAAAIQKSEAEAAARRQAVRYLGTVDCHWYPEAEAALINSLRTDPNECVRLEAALGLSRGCCCTKAITEALTICATGSARDKHPAENSPRVKAVAFVALQRCLACPAPAGEETPPESPEPAPEPREKAPAPREKVPEPIEKTALAPIAYRPLPAYYRRLDGVPRAVILAEARRAVAEMEQAQLAAATTATAPPSMLLSNGNRDMLSIFRFSWAAPARPTTAEPPVNPLTTPFVARGSGH